MATKTERIEKMTKVIKFSKYASKKELSSLSERVESLECAIYSIYKNFDSFNEDDHNLHEPLRDVFGNGGHFIGVSIDPVEIIESGTCNLIGQEFSLIQCPKASIPTNKWILRDGVYYIDFVIFDKISKFCREKVVSLKDGPFLNFNYPRHSKDLTIQNINNWIMQRYGRQGAYKPEYIEIFSNFINTDGEYINNAVIDGFHHADAFNMIRDSVLKYSSKSFVGISVHVGNIESKAFCKLFDFLKRSGYVDYVGLSFDVDCSDDIYPDLIKEKLLTLNEYVGNVHITSFNVTNREEKENVLSAIAYEDFSSLLKSCSNIEGFEISCLKPVSGYCGELFNTNHAQTQNYQSLVKAYSKQ
jgi:hypothetical protein